MLHSFTTNGAMVDPGRPTRAKGHQRVGWRSEGSEGLVQELPPQEDWPE